MTKIESVTWVAIIFSPIIDGSFTMASTANAMGLFMIYSALRSQQQ